MKCPNCSDSRLTLAERQGIEIDYCPDCRGVWLDRGELDKIIERTSSAIESSQPRQVSYKHESKSDSSYYGKKRKSLLGEIFDF